MSWKTLLFSKPCKLKIKNRQLVYCALDSDEEISIPMEDIGTIVLENPQIKISNYFLNLCAQFSITVFTCDDKHKPSGVMCPFYQHSRNTKIALAHVKMKEPFKKQIWQKIIKQKIKNQSSVIKIFFDDDIFDSFADKVNSGDTRNIEAQVSKKYWQMLFSDFKRHAGGKYNAALDYGYAIIRGVLSKYIASSGLVPCLGVHHCNELNPFNLTEDLIEPFRPFVDFIAALIDFSANEELSKDNKAHLLSILTTQCLYRNELIPIQNACDNVCKTFVKAILEKDVKYLELPEFIGVK